MSKKKKKKNNKKQNELVLVANQEMITAALKIELRKQLLFEGDSETASRLMDEHNFYSIIMGRTIKGQLLYITMEVSFKFMDEVIILCTGVFNPDNVMNAISQYSGVKFSTIKSPLPRSNSLNCYK